jgi:hypothetical protein
MSEEQKKKVHPIVERALEMAYKGVEPVEFDDYAVEQLQDLLRERFGKPDLLQAVVDLINLAGVLEKQGCPSASLKLMIVVSIAADALKDMNK